MEKFKWLFSVVFGLLSAFFQQYSLIIIFVAVVVVLDVVTGLVKAKATGEAISSEKGTKGFYKMVALFIALFFGFFLDYFIPYMLTTIGISFPITTCLFSMVFACYGILNESISICENLLLINPSLLPKWVVSLLSKSRDKIDEMGDEKK